MFTHEQDEIPRETILEASSRTTTKKRLDELSRNANKFLRVRVAGNNNISERTHVRLLKDADSAVVMWALQNKRSEHSHFVIVYDRFIRRGYDALVHPALAGHPLATNDELRTLLAFRKEAVDLAVVNNHLHRNNPQFFTIISHLLPADDKIDNGTTTWTEIERRANFLVHGTRWGER